MPDEEELGLLSDQIGTNPGVVDGGFGGITGLRTSTEKRARFGTNLTGRTGHPYQSYCRQRWSIYGFHSVVFAPSG